jgi:xanthine dehydrogenase accessory factor
MRPHEFFARVAALLEEGRPFATARLLDAEGSVPQAPGAAMIVFPDGSIEWTIGGGRFEATVILDALRLLEGGGAIEMKEYGLTRDELRMYCAGRARVLIEAHRPAPELVVFGGGHVGEALGRLAAELRLFRVTVIDDRPQFASRDRHPRADRVIQTDPLYRERIPPLGRWTYAVVVSRCHDVDKHLVRRLAGEDVAYVGMIGSKTKARGLLRELEAEGVPRERLERVRAPIGLDLGATKDPATVALSILAEVVKALNERSAAEAAATPAGEPAAPPPPAPGSPTA